MLARFVLLPLLLVPFLATSSAPAAPAAPRAATPSQPPQAIVNEGWAGIWDVHDETRDCTTGALLSTQDYQDTLCAGAPYYLTGPNITQAGPEPANCNGAGFSDTSFDRSCSAANYDCFRYSTSASWTRSGDQATTATTTSVWSTCGPSSCTTTTGARARIASGAAACAVVPTRAQTWGALKVIYR